MAQYTVTFSDSTGDENRVTLRSGIYPTFWVNDILEKVPFLERVPTHVKATFKETFEFDMEAESRFPSIIISMRDYIADDLHKYITLSPSEIKLLWNIFYTNKLCVKMTSEHLIERITNRNKKDPEEMEEDDECVISVLSKLGDVCNEFKRKFSARLATNKFIDFLHILIKTLNELLRRISLHLVCEFVNDETIFDVAIQEFDDITPVQTPEQSPVSVLPTKQSLVPEFLDVTTASVDARTKDLTNIIMKQVEKLQAQSREILEQNKTIEELLVKSKLVTTLETKLENVFSDFLEVAEKYETLEQENLELKKKISLNEELKKKSEADTGAQKQIDFWKSKVAELRSENANLKKTNDLLQEKISFPE